MYFIYIYLKGEVSSKSLYSAMLSSSVEVLYVEFQSGLIWTILYEQVPTTVRIISTPKIL